MNIMYKSLALSQLIRVILNGQAILIPYLAKKKPLPSFQTIRA
jgi:hypothetical protein